MDSQNNFDLKIFNQEFDKKELENTKFKPNDFEIKQKHHPKLNDIEKIILAMRLAFEFSLQKILNNQNPLPDILSNSEMTVGLIALSIFIGGMTLLIAGLMKD